jgi:thioesterase domain-containing protein/acyl carrier protein
MARWGAFELRDLYFFRPLAVADGAACDIRAKLIRSDEGYGFDLRSAHMVKGRKGWQLHAQARVLPVADTSRRMDVAAIAARLPAPETGDGLASPQEAHLTFGPRWRVLRSRSTGAREGLAHLSLPPAFRSEAGPWVLHPALMDLATGWAMSLIAGYRPDHLWVPVSYGLIRVLRPLPGDIVSHVTNATDNRADGATATFNVTLATPEGEVCVEIEGFSIRKLEGGLQFGPPDPRELEFDDGPGHDKPLSPAEERLLHAFSQGIRPDEGAQAFGRAVALGQPQIIVSSLDLPALIRQTAEADAAKSEGQTFDRPDLETAYVAPRSDIERTLVGFWQELLGVGQVGVEDSFFDLGGHSLIAVRLFAMVKKAWRVDFPISILFEAPTVAACAALIAAQVGDSVEGGGGCETGGPCAPLCPSGADASGRGWATAAVLPGGGHVRQCAEPAASGAADRRRPAVLRLAGARASGRSGPARHLPEAAADYIAELRQVQPRGPYMLGGFSGGGLTAWEMARQLRDAGEEVSVLVLLDTPLPMRPALSRADKAAIKWAEIKAEGPAYLLRWARARWAWEMQKRRPKTDADSPAQFHNAAIEAAFRHAIAVYDLPVWQGAAVLFRPPLDRKWQVTGGKWVSSAKEYVFDDNDLTRFAPALEVIEVPGDHDSMVLEPNVRVMAARLKSVIAHAEGVSSNVVPLATAAE